MKTFGETLRSFRHASNDPKRLNRRLSQERLGQLIGEEMEDRGFTGAAVGYWETNESRIHADDRKVLLALIKVLHQCGGLKTLADANHLLNLGNYRELNTEESKEVFMTTNPAKSGLSFLVEDFFTISEKEFQELLAKAQVGPQPVWPRVLAALMRKVTDRFSLSFTTLWWVGVWLVAWWLISPSLRLPFADQADLISAMLYFVAGSLVVPLLIGSLVNTKDSEYWKSQPGVSSCLLRLYTYQGAGIGFNLGYFFIFPIGLARYYLQLESSAWLGIAAATTGLIFGNLGARVVPHNLWLAYGRLKLSDGAIFFVAALLGPMWSFFFVEFHSTLLDPLTGSVVIFSAVATVIWLSARRSNRST